MASKRHVLDKEDLYLLINDAESELSSLHLSPSESCERVKLVMHIEKEHKLDTFTSNAKSYALQNALSYATLRIIFDISK